MKKLFLIGLLALGTNTAFAQSRCATTARCSTASGRLLINFTIGRALLLNVTPTATSLTAPTATDYNTGYAATTGPTATIKSNAPWTLAISASAATWTATNTSTEPARTNKPASDLLWATAAGGPFTALTTTPATVAAGVATAGTTAASLYYRTLYVWNLDTPGSYGLQIVFTISSP